MCALAVKSLSQRETFFSETTQGETDAVSMRMFFVMVARVTCNARLVINGVLPGSETYAGGMGAGLRYRQPRNLGYQLPAGMG